MAKFVKAPNINDEYTLPEVAGTSGQVLTMGTGGSTSWAVPVLAGNVDGAGQANRIAKFADADSVTSSSIRDDGTDVTVEANMTLNNGGTYTLKTQNDLTVVGSTDAAQNLTFGNSAMDFKGINFSGAVFNVNNNGTNRFNIDSLGDVNIAENLVVSGDVTGNSVIVDGGTSGQFLKADGSLDSNTYATTNALLDFVPASTGGEFGGDLNVTGNLTSDGTVGTLTAETGFEFEAPNTTRQTLYVNADSFRLYFDGTSGQNETFYVSQTGEVRFRVNGSSKHLFQTDGDAHHDGDVVAYSTTISDERLKDDIKTIENATDIVNNLRGVEYVWNSGSRKGQKEIGVIAQEVQKELPFLVREKELLDGEKRLTVDYEKIIGLLIEDAKAKDERIYKLEQKINSL